MESLSYRSALFYLLYYLILFSYCETKDIKINLLSETISRYYHLLPSVVITVNIPYLFLCSLNVSPTSLDYAFNCVNLFSNQAISST
jgi:hypothetical protein